MLLGTTGTGSGSPVGSTPLVTSPTSRVVQLGPPNRAGNGNLTDLWGIGVAFLVIFGVIAVVRLMFKGAGVVSEGPRDDKATLRRAKGEPVESPSAQGPPG